MLSKIPGPVTWTEPGCPNGRETYRGFCHAIGSDLDGPWILVEYPDGKIEQHRIHEHSDYKLGK